jgi:hypothetical protein
VRPVRKSDRPNEVCGRGASHVAAPMNEVHHAARDHDELLDKASSRVAATRRARPLERKSEPAIQSAPKTQGRAWGRNVAESIALRHPFDPGRAVRITICRNSGPPLWDGITRTVSELVTRLADAWAEFQLSRSSNPDQRLGPCDRVHVVPSVQ